MNPISAAQMIAPADKMHNAKVNCGQERNWADWVENGNGSRTEMGRERKWVENGSGSRTNRVGSPSLWNFVANAIFREIRPQT